MLDDERKERLMELFGAASELEGAARNAFIDAECAGDEELRAELIDLLGVPDARLEGFLEGPAVARADELESVFAEAGDFGTPMAAPTLPGYENLELIGEGGMGVVFRADQTEPVRRTVAIKVIRTGLDSRSVLRRFEAERHALALMSHSYVTAILDAGEDQEGRPYIVMEFVDGLPITDFCRENRLGLEQRVELCAKVCEGMEHAHRRGILHRDLKPSNVLTISENNKAVPKIIDFGIAKLAAADDQGERSLLTQQGAFLGTPEYMSPEQLVGDVSEVDTRSDIYCLGVMIYEIVTGALPFDAEHLRSGGFGRMVSILQHDEPPIPSARVKTLITKQDGSAPHGASRTRWIQRVRGDLDWVVMKALEKEPRRRYPTPGELAADLRRYLQKEPVEATPQEGVYRLVRFVRRYRAQVATGLLLVASLIAGLTGTLWFLVQSKENERRADERAAAAEAAQRAEVGSRLAAHATMALESDTNLALLLAIESAEHVGDAAAADAVYRALPTHDLIQATEFSGRNVEALIPMADGSVILEDYGLTFQRVVPETGEVLQRFDGHTDVILSIDVAPAADLAGTASRDGTARLWRLSDGALLKTLEVGSEASDFHFSADARRAIVRAVGGAGFVFDTDSGAILRRFLMPEREISSVHIRPDGRAALLCAHDGTMEVRWIDNGEILTEFAPCGDGHPRETCSCAFDPSGSSVIRRFRRPGKETALNLFSTQGELLRSFERVTSPHQGSRPSLFVSDGERVVEVSLLTGETLREVETEPHLWLLEVAPEEGYFVAEDLQLDLSLYDLGTGDRIRRLSGKQDKQNELCAAFPREGDRIFVGGKRLSVHTLIPDYAPTRVHGAGQPLRRSNVTSLEYVGDSVRAVERRPEGTELFSWLLHDVSGGVASSRRLTRLDGIDSLVLSSGGASLLGQAELPREAGGPRRFRFAVFDLDGALLAEREIEVERELRRVVWDGRFVCVQTRDGAEAHRVHVTDFETGATILEERFGVPNCSIHIRGTEERPYLAVPLGHDTRTDLFDLETGTRTHSISGPAGASQWDEALDVDRGLILIAQGNKRARTYSLEQQGARLVAEYTQLRRADIYPTGIVPNSDLGWVICENEVHLFNLLDGSPFAIMRMESRICAIDVREDGLELAAAGEDGLIQRWPMDPIEAARRSAVGELDLEALETFRIGTPAERSARERARLLANPTQRNLARLGEREASEGNLDGAIEFYRRCVSGSLLRKSLKHRYVRYIELVCRRLMERGDAAVDSGDGGALVAAVEQCVRCEIPREDLIAIPGFDRLLEIPEIQSLIEP